MSKNGILVSVAENQDGKNPQIVTPDFPLPTTDNTLQASTERIAKLADRLISSISSFNELQVALPYSQIDLKSIYPLSVLRDVITATAGNVTQSEGAFLITADADGAADVLFRSIERGRYVAGFDAIAGMAVKLPTRPTGNQSVEWGYTDFINGFVVGEDAGGLYTAIYRGGVKSSVRRRADWLNPMTGILDPSTLNVYRMPFRWYGRGPMKLTLATEENDIGGITVADATTLIDDGPITFDPNQPLSIRIKNNGTASALTAEVYGRHFYVLGDYRPSSRVTSVARIEQSVGTTFVPLIAYREKTGLYESISNKLQDVQILASGADIIFEVRLFTELTGGTFVDPPNTNGGLETSLEANNTATAVTNGIAVYEGLVAAGQGSSSGAFVKSLPQLPLPNNPSLWCLVARSVSGTATVTSIFNILEEW